MSTWVVLPTYNEAANIARLLSAVRSVVAAELLVVDDNSPDGTGQIADSLGRQFPNVHVIHRTKKMGLGVAYQAGFKFALDHGASHVIQMDADGSHPPALIPKLLDSLQRSDLVLASRYVDGGSMRIDPWRRLVSAVGNIYIRAMLGGEIRDWSTGYKAWQAKLLRQVLDRPLHATGYAWLMETTWHAQRLGAKIIEQPLQFEARSGGQSKFNLGIVKEDIITAWRLNRSHGLTGH